MHFRLVLVYDLLEDRHRDDINNILLFLSYKTNRFHVAIGLYCNKSQITSKCGENIGDTGHNFFCSCHILTLSVIYYWTYAWKHRICSWIIFGIQTDLSLDTSTMDIPVSFAPFNIACDIGAAPFHCGRRDGWMFIAPLRWKWITQ